MELSKALIIAAAGSGARMQSTTPKPFIQLAGKTILEHTLRRFLPLKGLGCIVIAISSKLMTQAQAVLQKCVPAEVDRRCVEGGQTRQQSIGKALQQVGGTDLVMVHDAVRPFITLDQIEVCCNQAAVVGAAVAGIPAIDTIKEVDADELVTRTPDRKKMWQIQTPQVFKTALLKKAYSKAEQENYRATDDASLVEWLGEPVRVVCAGRSNIKITYPQDLKLAQILLEEEFSSL